MCLLWLKWKMNLGLVVYVSFISVGLFWVWIAAPLLVVPEVLAAGGAAECREGELGRRMEEKVSWDLRIII